MRERIRTLPGTLPLDKNPVTRAFPFLQKPNLLGWLGKLTLWHYNRPASTVGNMLFSAMLFLVAISLGIRQRHNDRLMFVRTNRCRPQNIGALTCHKVTLEAGATTCEASYFSGSPRGNQQVTQVRCRFLPESARQGLLPPCTFYTNDANTIEALRSSGTRRNHQNVLLQLHLRGSMQCLRI